MAADLTVTAIRLPALRPDGQPARAHTQGLEITSGKYYVTARQEDVVPKRALLLRTEARGADWDVWDITPIDARGGLTTLDHPGGMQSDGERLWIPVAESKRKGRSLIRVVPMANLVPGQSIKPQFEFPVTITSARWPFGRPAGLCSAPTGTLRPFMFGISMVACSGP